MVERVELGRLRDFLIGQLAIDPVPDQASFRIVELLKERYGMDIEVATAMLSEMRGEVDCIYDIERLSQIS